MWDDASVKMRAPYVVKAMAEDKALREWAEYLMRYAPKRMTMFRCRPGEPLWHTLREPGESTCGALVRDFMVNNHVYNAGELLKVCIRYHGADGYREAAKIILCELAFAVAGDMWVDKAAGLKKDFGHGFSLMLEYPAPSVPIAYDCYTGGIELSIPLWNEYEGRCGSKKSVVISTWETIGFDEFRAMSSPKDAFTAQFSLVTAASWIGDPSAQAITAVSAAAYAPRGMGGSSFKTLRADLSGFVAKRTDDIDAAWAAAKRP